MKESEYKIDCRDKNREQLQNTENRYKKQTASTEDRRQVRKTDSRYGGQTVGTLDRRKKRE